MFFNKDTRLVEALLKTVYIYYLEYPLRFNLRYIVDKTTMDNLTLSNS